MVGIYSGVVFAVFAVDFGLSHNPDEAQSPSQLSTYVEQADRVVPRDEDL
jgi:hypothetical protein